MIHPNTALVKVSPTIGYGVIATAPLPRGTLIYVRDTLEQVIAPDSEVMQCPILGPTLLTYAYRNSHGSFIVSWDHGKYVNHHCLPNTLATAYDCEIVVRDIALGEAITTDYGLLNIMECLDHRCNTPQCRSIIREGFDWSLLPTWDPLVLDALQCLDVEKDVLFPLLDQKLQGELRALKANPQAYRSISERAMRPLP